MKSQDVKPHEQEVLNTIRDLEGDDEESNYIGYRETAAALGKGEASVKKATARLEFLKLIDISRKGRHQLRTQERVKKDEEFRQRRAEEIKRKFEEDMQAIREAILANLDSEWCFDGAWITHKTGIHYERAIDQICQTLLDEGLISEHDGKIYPPDYQPPTDEPPEDEPPVDVLDACIQDLEDVEERKRAIEKRIKTTFTINDCEATLGRLAIGKDYNKRAAAAFTRNGLAEELLRQQGDNFLIAQDENEPLEHTARVLTLQSGGTWNDDEARFGKPAADILATYTTCWGIISADLDMDDKEDRATYMKYRRYIKSWLDLCEKYGSDTKAHEIERVFAHAKHQAEEAEVKLKAPYECKKASLTANLTWLGAPNGVINLATGELITDKNAAAEKFVIGRLPDAIDLEAQSDVADALLSHIPDAIAQNLLEHIAFALRGNPNRSFLLLLGKGGGGKSTFMKALQDAFGGYYTSAVHEDAFAHKKGGSAGLSPEGEALAHPKRLAFLSEADKAMYSGERLKAISGGDDITYRRLRAQLRTSPVTATVIMSANNPPSFDGTDAALIDRMKVFPYGAIPEEKRVADMLTAFRGDDEESKLARQALVAKVLKAGFELGDDAPTIAEEVSEEIRRVTAELLGDAGAWIKDNVIELPGSNLHTARAWKALCAALDAPEGAKIAGGMAQRRVTRFINELHNRKQETVRDANNGGLSRRGWKGLGLKDDNTNTDLPI